ncbi:MAG: hypothetical protein ACFNKL_03470 [Treponema sp.]
MSVWGNMYFLKADVKAENIWDCIRGTFPTYGLTEAMPKHFSIERDNSIILWDCQNGSQDFAEFRFYADTEDGKREVRIVFDKAVKPKKWTDGRKNVHALLFEETADAPTLQFCHTFFALVKEKKLVPNIYFQSRIIDDTPDVYRQVIEKKDIARPVKPDFPVVVKLCADKDGNFFFPKEWIEKFKEDLWFINVDAFVRCYGIFPLMNEENLKKYNPELHTIMKKIKNNPEANSKLDERIKEVLQERRDAMSLVYRSDSRIETETAAGRISIRELSPNPDFISQPLNDIPYNSEEQYEKLKNQIISSVDYELYLAPNIQKYLPDFLDKMRKEDLLIRQKAQLLLKEMGLDENQIEAAFNRLGKVEKENAELMQTINKQAKRIDELETENSKLKDTTAAVDADISFNPLVSSPAYRVEADAQETRAAIDELEHDLKKLQNTKKLLEGEISSLNTKCANLQNRYDEWDAMLIRKQNENSNGCIYLEIPCTEENLFLNEIQDYLYSLLYEMLEKEKANLPGNKQDEANRKRDVVANLLEKRKFYWEKSVTGEKLREIENMLRSTQTLPLSKLSHEGFKEVRNGTHLVYSFYKEKYKYSTSWTPSDRKAAEKVLRDIKNIMFLT